MNSDEFRRVSRDAEHAIKNGPDRRFAASACSLHSMSDDAKVMLAAKHLLLAGKGPEPPESADSWSETRDWVVGQIGRLIAENRVFDDTTPENINQWTTPKKQ